MQPVAYTNFALRKFEEPMRKKLLNKALALKIRLSIAEVNVAHCLEQLGTPVLESTFEYLL